MTTMLPRMTPATGLGYATPSAKAWIHGGSPTKGFLSTVLSGDRHPARLVLRVGRSPSVNGRLQRRAAELDRLVGQMRTYPSAGYAHAVSC